jgi:hypothetical protein
MRDERRIRIQQSNSETQINGFGVMWVDRNPSANVNLIKRSPHAFKTLRSQNSDNVAEF